MARYELGMEFLDDLRRIDAQMRDTKKRLEVAVKASGTTVTEVFGVGPYVAATVIGYVGDVRRFSDRDHFAAYNGTAPIEVSSGNHKIFRLSRRGNRRLNHAIHMAAVTQVRFRHSDGRAYYDRKVKEGKTHKEALRCLKRRISDAIFAHLVADAKRKAEAAKAGPGGQMGNGSVASVAGSHPDKPALRKSHSRASDNTRASRRLAPTISTPTRPGKATSMAKKAPACGLAPPLRARQPNERPGHQLPGTRSVTSRNDARDDLCSAWLRPAAGPSGHGPPSPVLLSSVPGPAHRASQRDKAEPVCVEVDMGSASSRGVLLTKRGWSAYAVADARSS